MSLRRYAAALPALIVPALALAGSVQGTCVKLLAPIGSQDCIPIRPGVETWFLYFGEASQWIYNVAVGICVLWMLIGGIEIMISGDNNAVRERGIEHMKAAVLGLVILIFAGVILRTLNNIFFV